MRHPIAVLGPALGVYKCSLARATGPFSSHGCFCLVQRERPGKLLEDSQPLCETPYKLNSMFPVNISTPPLYSRIQLEYAACLLHLELEVGNHLKYMAIRT